jgi:hypothetical protein
MPAIVVGYDINFLDNLTMLYKLLQLLYVRQLSDPPNWGSRGRETYTSW